MSSSAYLGEMETDFIKPDMSKVNPRITDLPRDPAAFAVTCFAEDVLSYWTSLLRKYDDPALVYKRSNFKDAMKHAIKSREGFGPLPPHIARHWETQFQQAWDLITRDLPTIEELAVFRFALVADFHRGSASMWADWLYWSKHQPTPVMMDKDLFWVCLGKSMPFALHVRRN